MLEANPRASRTVPFVAKATGRAAGQGRRPGHAGCDDRASCATRACCRRWATAAPCRSTRRSRSRRRSCRSSGSAPQEGRAVDSVLGPEMRSTGEVMGIDSNFGAAFAKTQMGAPVAGCRRRGGSSSRSPTATSAAMIFPLMRLADLGFELLVHAWHRRRAAPQRRLGRGGPQAQRGPRAERRAHDRADDRGRRGRHGRQHARGQRRPSGRLRHPNRRDEHGSPYHHDDPAARCRRARASSRPAARPCGLPPCRSTRRRWTWRRARRRRCRNVRRRLRWRRNGCDRMNDIERARRAGVFTQRARWPRTSPRAPITGSSWKCRRSPRWRGPGSSWHSRSAAS